MKKIVTLLLFILTLQANAQSKQNFPFDIYTLSVCFTKNDSLLPLGNGDSFTYINILTGKPAFAKKFRLAFPFIGKAAIAGINGRYGIIGRNGEWLKQPIYTKFHIEDNSVAVLNEDNGSKYTYNLNSLKENCGYVSCAMPSLPMYFARKDPDGKWVIAGREKKIATAYDSIAEIYGNRVIAVKKGKFGIADFEGNTLIPFEYSAISTPDNITGQVAIHGLLKGKEYYYYDLAAKKVTLILKSKYLCPAARGVDLKNAFGIYKEGTDYNILFKDGSTLPQCYDLITPNGRIAVKGTGVYILNDDKTATLYYTK